MVLSLSLVISTIATTTSGYLTITSGSVLGILRWKTPILILRSERQGDSSKLLFRVTENTPREKTVILYNKSEEKSFYQIELFKVDNGRNSILSLNNPEDKNKILPQSTLNPGERITIKLEEPTLLNINFSILYQDSHGIYWQQELGCAPKFLGDVQQALKRRTEMMGRT